MNWLIEFVSSNPFGLPLGIFLFLIFALNLPFILFLFFQSFIAILGGWNTDNYLDDDIPIPHKFYLLFLPMNLLIVIPWLLTRGWVKIAGMIAIVLFFTFHILRQVFFLGQSFGWEWTHWFVFVVSFLIFTVVFFVVAFWEEITSQN